MANKQIGSQGLFHDPATSLYHLDLGKKIVKQNGRYALPIDMEDQQVSYGRPTNHS